MLSTPFYSHDIPVCRKRSHSPRHTLDHAFSWKHPLAVPAAFEEWLRVGAGFAVPGREERKPRAGALAETS